MPAIMWNALRSLYIWSAIALLTTAMYIVGLPLFLVAMPFDRKRALGHWWAQRWGRIILKINNRWSSKVLHMERIPRDKPLVVVSNHQGMGDIMMAFCLDIHFKWISKAANFYVPCMGWFMFHAGYIPLVRGDKKSIARCMERARKYLDQGVSVLFFPEGTRSRDGEIQPFKNGAFRLALEAGVDILPCAISGTADALPKHSWRFSDEQSHMRILVGDVISTRGHSEATLDELMAHARASVLALKDELDGRAAAPRLRATA
jgi:1-acyl-sn-glycerol-3-phosphate acyltransferase